MRSNDKGDRYARTIEGSPHKFHISVSSLFIEQGWGSAHRCLCTTYDGVVNILPQKMIYILRGIRSAFVLLLAWWFEIPWPVFSPAFSSFFFFFFYYEDMIRSIWKVIQFFPVAGNIYDDIVIRGRLLCNSCGWRWNLLRIFDIETIDKSVWVKLVTRSNLIWIYKSEFRLTSDTSISEFNTKSFENLLLKSLLWYVFYESNLL